MNNFFTLYLTDHLISRLCTHRLPLALSFVLQHIMSNPVFALTGSRQPLLSHHNTQCQTPSSHPPTPLCIHKITKHTCTTSHAHQPSKITNSVGYIAIYLLFVLKHQLAHHSIILQLYGSNL